MAAADKDSMVNQPLDAVHLVDYDPNWPQLFEAAAVDLRVVFGDECVGLEHFGSTSVPGLRSKPLIDILLAVKSLETPEYYAAKVESLGYIYLPEVSPEDRLVFRRGMPRTHHLHIVSFGSDAWVRPLVFRDAIRENESLRQAYGELKVDMADRFGADRDQYTASKTDFITQKTDEAMKDWAHRYQG